MADEKQLQLLEKIQELELVAIDLNLYLDTHPEDSEALNDFQYASDSMRKMVRKYEEKYGPFMNFGWHQTALAEWKWLCQPWPWEM